MPSLLLTGAAGQRHQLRSGIQAVWPSWVFTPGGKVQEAIHAPTRVALHL